MYVFLGAERKYVGGCCQEVCEVGAARMYVFLVLKGSM